MSPRPRPLVLKIPVVQNYGGLPLSEIFERYAQDDNTAWYRPA